VVKEIIEPRGIPKPMGPYSQAVVTTGGKLVFISGQVPEDALGNLVGKGDIEAQTKQVLSNLKIIVEEASGTVAILSRSQYLWWRSPHPPMG
jgi:enamine deaminase RidA (YjgF/YER057c/UK114 family)